MKRSGVLFGILLVLLGAFLLWAALSRPCNGARDTKAKAVGMVLETKGKPSALLSTGKPKTLFPMDSITAGQILVTPANSRLLFVLFATNKEYSIASSSKVQILPSGIKKISGTVKGATTQVSLNLPKNTDIYSRRMLGEVVIGDTSGIAKSGIPASPGPKDKTKGLCPTSGSERTTGSTHLKGNEKMPETPAETRIPASAGSGHKPPIKPVTPEIQPPVPVIKRDRQKLVELLYPTRDGCVLDNRVTFTWRSGTPKAKAKFFLADYPGRKVFFKTDVTGKTAFTYPPAKAPSLEPGKQYLTIIMVQVPGKKKASWVSSEAVFKILPKDKADSIKKCQSYVESLRKQKSREQAARMQLLLIYLDNRLYREAVDMGKSLETGMPDNPNIQYYLALAYRGQGNTREAQKYESKYKKNAK